MATKPLKKPQNRTQNLKLHFLSILHLRFKLLKFYLFIHSWPVPKSLFGKYSFIRPNTVLSVPAYGKTCHWQLAWAHKNLNHGKIRWKVW